VRYKQATVRSLRVSLSPFRSVQWGMSPDSYPTGASRPKHSRRSVLVRYTRKSCRPGYACGLLIGLLYSRDQFACHASDTRETAMNMAMCQASQMMRRTGQTECNKWCENTAFVTRLRGLQLPSVQDSLTDLLCSRAHHGGWPRLSPQSAQQKSPIVPI
jgi:hypothetical protein